MGSDPPAPDARRGTPAERILVVRSIRGRLIAGGLLTVSLPLAAFAVVIGAVLWHFYLHQMEGELATRARPPRRSRRSAGSATPTHASRSPTPTVLVRATPDAADQRHQRYVQWLNAGASEPDVLQLDVVWTPEFAAAGWILPLDRFGPDADRFFEGVIAADRVRGRLYALPWFADVGMLYYRSDLVARPPATLDELAAESLRLQRERGLPYGFVWQGQRYEGLVCVFSEVLGGFGGAILDARGEVTVDAAPAVRALTFLRDAIRTGASPAAVATWQEEQARFAFQNGQAAFMRNWPYARALADDRRGAPPARARRVPRVRPRLRAHRGRAGHRHRADRAPHLRGAPVGDPGGEHVPAGGGGVAAVPRAAGAGAHRHIPGAGAPVPHLRDAAHRVAAARVLPPAPARPRAGGAGRRRDAPGGTPARRAPPRGARPRHHRDAHLHLLLERVLVRALLHDPARAPHGLRRRGPPPRPVPGVLGRGVRRLRRRDHARRRDRRGLPAPHRPRAHRASEPLRRRADARLRGSCYTRVLTLTPERSP